MTNVLNIYKNDEVIATGERNENGKATVTINNLEANTTYPKGMFKAAWLSNQGESQKIDIEEFKTNPIKVTGVNIEKELLHLSINKSEKLVVNVTPSTATDKSVIFNSSHEEVATVNSDGLVTGLSVGETLVKVTTIDGNKTAEINVNVSE